MQCWGEQQVWEELKGETGVGYAQNRLCGVLKELLQCERKQKQSTKPNNKFSRYTFVTVMKLSCLDLPSVLRLTALLSSNMLSLSPSNLFFS